MKKWQKGLAVAGAAALAVGLSACGKSSKDAASKGDDSTPTLLMYRVGDKPDNYDQLIDNANKIIEKKNWGKIKNGICWLGRLGPKKCQQSLLLVKAMIFH